MKIHKKKIDKNFFFFLQAEKSAENLNAEINENEKLMETITKNWQERIAESDKISKVKFSLFRLISF